MQLCLKNCVQYLVCMSSSPSDKWLSMNCPYLDSLSEQNDKYFSKEPLVLEKMSITPCSSVAYMHEGNIFFLIFFSYTVLKYHLTNCYKSTGRISGYILSRRTAKRKCTSLARFPARSCWKSEDRLQEYILCWLELYFLEPIFLWAILQDSFMESS